MSCGPLSAATDSVSAERETLLGPRPNGFSGTRQDGPEPIASPTDGASVIGRRSKFAPPPVPAMAVPRERLVRGLDNAVGRKITLLIGPPGAGKSVLLGQWAASQPRLDTAWLTIDSDDNDPSHFAQDLCATLPWSDPSAPRAVLGRLDPAGHAMGSAFVATLLASLEEMSSIVLVLDDFHLLGNTALLGEFDSIVQQAPPSLHLLISSRVDPALRYHRLLVRDEVAELRQGDLAFDRADAGKLIGQISRCHLADSQIDTLVERTDGWAAGLQLAALSLRGCQDVDQFVETFAGDERHVADYLTEQVLNRQSPSTRRFLLRTSVVDQMSAPLCDHLTGDRDGQAMLERLDRGSMFIIRLDNRREWFRYQQLFQTLLRHHLRAEDADLELALLERAADWHLVHDDVETGIHYLIAGRAWERVLDVAFAQSRAMYVQGRSAAVAAWIEVVPQAVRAGRTSVMLLDAAARAMAGEPGAASDILEELDREPSTSAADRVAADLIRSFSVLARSGTAGVVAAADRVLRGANELEEADIPDVLGLTPTRDSMLALARLSRGIALVYEGQDAEASLSLTSLTSLRAGWPGWDIYALGSLALLSAWSGRLVSAEQLASQAVSQAREFDLLRHPCTTDASLALAHVARERDDVEAAELHLAEADSRSYQTAPSLIPVLLALQRALLTLSTGRPEEGLTIMASYRGADHPAHPPAIRSRRRAVEAALLIALRDVDAAQRVLEAAGDQATVDGQAAGMHLAVERGDLSTAHQILARWPNSADSRPQVERALWEAVLDYVDGDVDGALARMRVVAQDASEQGHVRLFLDAGEHVRDLARVLYHADPTPFLRTVVDHPGAASPKHRPVKGLVEQLTDRERLVLGYLPSRLSNAEIAAELRVSLNTLKSHLKHIYRKLGVAGRNEAIARAQQLRLL